jgi:hypothetical protein
MMSGFTKGPWELTTETLSEEVCTVHGITRQPTEDGFGQGWVYVVPSGNFTVRTDEEQLANAHLIAAAPTLYEALLEAHEFIGDQFADLEAQALDGEHVSREAQPIWEKICLALAEAEVSE